MPLYIPGPPGANGATGATGATGPAGPAGSNAAAINWRGAYNTTTSYAIGDGCTLSNSGYLCTTATTGNTPPNTTYWQAVTLSGSYAYKNANYTAANGDNLVVDTSSASVTITLPSSGVVQIKDALNTFGTNNCIIAAASGQTLTGKTYSGASTVNLNAPGNNAIIYCSSTVAYVEQVESGLWEEIDASAASDVAFTALIGDTMEYEFNFYNVSTSASTQIVFEVGYGTTPTYETSSVYNQVETANTSISQGTNPLGNLTNNTAQIWSNSSGRGWIISSGSTVKLHVSSDYNVSKYDCVISMTSSPFSAWKIYPQSGTISGVFTLNWRKLNI